MPLLLNNFRAELPMSVYSSNQVITTRRCHSCHVPLFFKSHRFQTDSNTQSRFPPRHACAVGRLSTGAELEVLRTVDFDRVHVDVLVVEVEPDNPTKEALVRALLLENGFRSDGFRNDGNNRLKSEWFVHKGFVPMSRASFTTTATTTAPMSAAT